MKKKILAALMAATLVLSMTACGGESTENDTQSTNGDTTVETKSDKTVDVTIEEQELFNQGGIVITATGIDMNGSWGPEIKILVENNSEQNITVQTRNSSVNGYMTDLEISCDVAIGKKANDTLDILSSDLEKCDIETISDIEFTFHIFNAETWDTIVDSDVITINTSANGTITQSYDDSGDVLYENGGIRIVSKGLAEDELYGPEVVLYIENNSERNVTIQSRETSVNGFMIEPTMSPEIVPGKKAVTEMSFYSTDLEDNNIEEIETIETSFHIFDTDSWDTIEDTTPITITFDGMK